MSADKIVALVLAALVLVGPSALKWLEGVLAGVRRQPDAHPHGTTYIAAIENLGIVRTRLVQTDSLGEAQKAAIDTLTLALVGGSEK